MVAHRPRIAYAWKVDPTNPSSDQNIGFIDADGTNPVDLTNGCRGAHGRLGAGREPDPWLRESYPAIGNGVAMLAVDPNQALPPLEMGIGEDGGYGSWQRLAP